MNFLKNAYKRSPAAFSAILCLAAALISAAICALVTLIPMRIRAIDLTPQKLFSLSDETVDILNGLDNDVEILLVSNTGIEDSGTVAKLLTLYKSYSGKLTVKLVFPDELPEEYGTLSEGSVIVKGPHRETVVYSSDYYDVSDEYFNISYNYYYYATQQGYNLGTYLEFMKNGYGEALGLYDIANYELILTTAIDYVSKDNITTVLALTNHGETMLEAYLYSEFRQTFTEVTFGTLSQGVPENTECIIISDPTSDITEAEYQTLTEYLSGGGKLALITSYSNVAKLTLLRKLCDQFGLTTDGGFVCEDDENRNMNGYPQILRPITLPEALGGKLTAGEYSPVFSGGTGITVTEKEGVDCSVFLKTSPNAYVKTDAENSESADFDETKDIRGEFALGVIAENKNGGGALMWISSFSLNNSDYDLVATGDNYPLFTAALAALNDSLSAPDIPSISTVSDVLTAPKSAFAVGMVIAISVPCLLMIAAAIITIKRRKPKAYDTQTDGIDSEMLGDNADTEQ